MGFYPAPSPVLPHFWFWLARRLFELASLFPSDIAWRQRSSRKQAKCRRRGRQPIVPRPAQTLCTGRQEPCVVLSLQRILAQSRRYSMHALDVCHLRIFASTCAFSEISIDGKNDSSLPWQFGHVANDFRRWRFYTHDWRGDGDTLI